MYFSIFPFLSIANIEQSFSFEAPLHVLYAICFFPNVLILMLLPMKRQHIHIPHHNTQREL